MRKYKTSIMIVDDHPIIHDGVKTLLASESDLEVRSVAFTAQEAVDLLETHVPDLAIVDLSLSDSDGTYLIQRIRVCFPHLKILVYTMSEEILFAERTALAGADGYVMKTLPPSALKKAIRNILAGGAHFSAEVRERVQKKLDGKNSGHHSMLDILSNREMDIFKLIGQGLDTVQIAVKLNISRNTVDTHRINIKNKLEMPNGKALDRYAFEVIQRGRKP